ncbi:MAG: hypothetical protein Q7J45_00930 [bacterium]|nr:hypothetical protein [bacterium]
MEGMPRKRVFAVGILVIAIVILILAFVFVRIQTNSTDNLVATGSETINTITQGKTSGTDSTAPRLSIAEAIQEIHRTYDYGSGADIIATSTNRVWFMAPWAKDGCPYYSYIDLATGKEVETTLRACPKINVQDSYPFYIEDCEYSECYDFKTLYVVNLDTLERKPVHVISKQNETTKKGCYDADFGVSCASNITISKGILSIPIYKNSVRKPQEFFYENGEPIRVDTVDLFEKFGLK